ncbi:MAG: hypothetical protein GY801_20390 [bacterium]|nr:hypothetical protein [bacterium]
MVTRALLKAEIDSLREEDLDIVYSMIASIIRQYENVSQQNFMTKLRKISIQASPAFSRNIEHYLKQQGKTAMPGFPGTGESQSSS